MPGNTSFLPEDYLQRKIARRTNAICLSLFAVITVGVVAAFFVTDQQKTEVLKQQEQVNASYAEAKKRLEELDELQQRKQDMVRKAKIIAVLVERVPRSLVLAEMINHMPPALSLTEFELDTTVLRTAARPKTAIDRQRERLNQKKKVEDNAQPEAPPTAVGLKLVGVAPTDVEISTFISRLNQHPMFDKVLLSFAEQTRVEGQSMRKFKIEASLNQDVSLVGIEPTKISRKLPGDPMGNQVRIGDHEPEPQQVGSVPTP